MHVCKFFIFVCKFLDPLFRSYKLIACLIVSSNCRDVVDFVEINADFKDTINILQPRYYFI